mmetsp:Transcript_54875/g.95946  ORF Transcript_54875/g.95946 Transcript_54875/m.95946 type:complete len:420 (-) Transcript_54875:1365-2624(-)
MVAVLVEWILLLFFILATDHTSRAEVQQVLGDVAHHALGRLALVVANHASSAQVYQIAGQVTHYDGRTHGSAVQRNNLTVLVGKVHDEVRVRVLEQFGRVEIKLQRVEEVLRGVAPEQIGNRVDPQAQLKVLLEVLEGHLAVRNVVVGGQRWQDVTQGQVHTALHRRSVRGLILLTGKSHMQALALFVARTSVQHRGRQQKSLRVLENHRGGLILRNGALAEGIADKVKALVAVGGLNVNLTQGVAQMVRACTVHAHIQHVMARQMIRIAHHNAFDQVERNDQIERLRLVFTSHAGLSNHQELSLRINCEAHRKPGGGLGLWRVLAAIQHLAGVAHHHGHGIGEVLAVLHLHHLRHHHDIVVIGRPAEDVRGLRLAFHLGDAVNHQIIEVALHGIPLVGLVGRIVAVHCEGLGLEDTAH